MPVRSAAFARLFTWTGALLFVVSLGYFLVSYLTAFGEAAGEAAGGAIVWNAGLFTAFALHHSVFARGPIRRWVARLAGTDLERSFYVWVASLLFLLVCAWWRPVPGVAWSASGGVVWTLRAVQGAALWLVLRSARVLDIWDLAGLRPLRPLRPDVLGPSEYKTTGPYGWVRHPIYAGWLLFVFAASPMTMTRLAFAVLSGAYLLIAIPFEERTMREAPGSAYERYRATVRWRLLPGVF